MIRQVESFPSDIFHAPFHMSFLPSGPYITETILKTIETGHLHQGFCRLLVTTDKVLDGYTHIVIDHHGRDTMYIIRKTKRFAIPERAVYFLKTKRTAGGSPPPQNIFDRLTPVFT